MFVMKQLALCLYPENLSEQLITSNKKRVKKEELFFTVPQFCFLCFLLSVTADAAAVAAAVAVAAVVAAAVAAVVVVAAVAAV